MRHVTERAFRIALERIPMLGPGFGKLGHSWRMACGAPVPVSIYWPVVPDNSLTDGSAWRLIGDPEASQHADVTLPTCPECRVLLDAALEGRDLRAALAHAEAKP